MLISAARDSVYDTVTLTVVQQCLCDPGDAPVGFRSSRGHTPHCCAQALEREYKQASEALASTRAAEAAERKTAAQREHDAAGLRAELAEARALHAAAAALVREYEDGVAARCAAPCCLYSPIAVPHAEIVRS
jgi:hypothetical protein